MSHEIILWAIAALAVIVLIAAAIIRRFRRETGRRQKLVEWNGYDEIHYEQDDEEL